jgi:hypothetical protein
MFIKLLLSISIQGTKISKNYHDDSFYAIGQMNLGKGIKDSHIVDLHPGQLVGFSTFMPLVVRRPITKTEKQKH